ncbi:lamin tail domain-containing protein [Streptomyces sp. me109]|uniref:lamin tail domain-containing protein n=1 Tax=Streptomyces sp. me109 TaxID=1827853 RepID=UPI0011CE1937|nr:lamin tail domain-containing protein [Streptomyces sp. me109]TXS63936.1 lamin tail domain-containing protein [Streptomyces sp. me109]
MTRQPHRHHALKVSNCRSSAPVLYPDASFRRTGARNLDGWTLSDEDGHTYTFRHYRLDGRSTVRVHVGVGRDTYRDVCRDRRNYVWDNRSDTATLRNDHGRFIDDASWGRHHRDGYNSNYHDRRL